MRETRAVATNYCARVAASKVSAWACGVALVSALAAWCPAPVIAQGIEVGRISDLDLDAVRRIIDQSDDVGMPVPTEERALSLEAAVKTALEENLGLQIVAVGAESSALEIDASRSKFHPVGVIGGDASGTRRNEDAPNLQDQSTDAQNAQILVRQEVPTGGNVSVGVGYGREEKTETVQDGINPIRSQSSSNQIGGLGIEISQPLLRGGRTYVARQQILNAEYDNAVSRADLRRQILLVTAETKSAYYSVIGAMRQIEVVEQALVRDAELIRASSALFEAGRVSKVDVFSAEISESNDQARLASSRADLEVAQNELRKVLGLPVHVQVTVTDETIPFRPIRIELDQWIARAIANRPEIVRLQARLEKAELAHKVSKNSALPSLDVNGGFQPGFDWKSYNYNAGITFEMPFGNVGPRAKEAQARLEVSRVRHELARQRRDIELEVRETEIRLRESVTRLKSLTTQVESARRKGEIARGRFEMGLANNLDITNADEELIRSESLLLQALVDYATNIALLEARVGGDI